MTWFWADKRPGYSFADHQTAAVTPVVGDYCTLKIWDESSNDTWYGAIDGTTFAASTPNGSGSDWMEAGLGSYNADQTLKYTVANQLQYRQGTTWYSSGYAQAMYCSTPAAAGWVSDETYYESYDYIH